MSADSSQSRPGARGRVALVVMAAAALAAFLALVALGWQRSGPPVDPGIAAAPPPGGTADRRPADSPAAASSPGPARGEAGIPHTELPLRLVATVLRENRRLSLATLEDVDHGGHEVMGEGQPFRHHPAVRITSVERGRVLLDNDGVTEQLLIDRGFRPSHPVDLPPEEVARRREIGQRIRALTDAGEDFRELNPGQRTGLLTEGEVSPVYEDGELVGIQVEAIREGGVYEQFGLRNGDVVTAVNGVPLGEPTAAAEVLTEVVLSDLLEVAVERADGTEEVISMPTAEFNRAVQAIE